MVRLEGAEHRHQRGFTLIELMIVVAIIAVLAIVVVPQFFKESRKVKADTEVSAMFAEISVRQEQYKLENSVYIDLALCPTTSTTAGTASSTCIGGTFAGWVDARVNPPEAVLRCTYQVVSGDNSTTVTNPGGFTWSSPAMNWWYVIATCDSDGQGGTNATFFTSSTDSRIQKQNEGK